MGIAIRIGIGAQRVGGGGGGIAAPVNNTAPTITGSLFDDQTAGSTSGTWTPTPNEYQYAWTANGSPIGTGTTQSLSGLAGQTLALSVRARLTGGTWSSYVAATGGGVVQAAGVPGLLDDGIWAEAYSDTASYSGLTGTVTVAGLPYGLSGVASGGTLTVTGTPL